MKAGGIKMNEDIVKSLNVYKKQLNQGYIQIAYVTLMKYLAELKVKFSKIYHTGNISFGYLYYTYFPFSNDFFRARKLRMGIVLNHKELRIELWLMGQNAEIQKKYWELLKESRWILDKNEMPRYAILEVILEERINFDQKEKMTEHIINQSKNLAIDMQKYLATFDEIS